MTIQTRLMTTTAFLFTAGLATAGSFWEGSDWLSVREAPVFEATVKNDSRAADGTSWFFRTIVNEKDVVSARWTATGLGVFDLYVNGVRVGNDFLKPGFTHYQKTKYSFSYDVTPLFKKARGASNALAAEVSAGWWRDKIVSRNGQTGFAGKKSAFRGVLEVTFADGATRRYGSNTADWRAGIAGPVTHAGIFDGEEHDARLAPPLFGESLRSVPEVNDEFKGEILPTQGAEVTLREDRVLKPVEAYVWKGVTGAREGEGTNRVYGTVVKTVRCRPGEPWKLAPGETLVVDFGQNAAAVPRFRFSAAAGTVLTTLPGEMLNDANGETSRGNDGPAGSLYRVNLRSPEAGMRFVYTFAGRGEEAYTPRFSFCGYRYLSLTATAPVTIASVLSVPVTSIRPEREIGSLEVGDKSVNRLIQNVYWGQLSNYLSVPTDCPQRNERLGWSADTQVFCEAGAFNADTRTFFNKWMRDLVDTQYPQGGFTGVAPISQYGAAASMRIGWSDAGVIVPYQIWKQFGDTELVRKNWPAMVKYMRRVNETRYRNEAILHEAENFQWADWLSFEKFESAGGGGNPANWAFNIVKGKRVAKPGVVDYWEYLGGCYWLLDAGLMARMASAIGEDPAPYREMAAAAKAYLKERYFKTDDGLVLPIFRDMQTPALFALKLGLVEGSAKEKTIAALRENFRLHGGSLQTGFLGTSILMDTLTENGLVDLAYDVLFNHGFPGWLYSVDQGATTIWERWNSYTKEKGFGPVGMNSFNHYAYGAVLAWLYKTAAGIAADPEAPGFKRILLKPIPDRRLGFLKASYRSAAGLITSAWRYEGDTWVWTFEIPAGAVGLVTLPGESEAHTYAPGRHVVRRP